jgi:HlyD family secretion protein
MVTAPISGDLQRLTLREGDPVTEGQVLARILSASGSEQSKRVAEASLEAARARLVQVELTLKDVVELAMQARIEAGRRESLAEQDIITLEMLEQARLAAQSAFRQQAVAEAALVAARAEVRAAEAMLLSYDSMDRDGAAFEMVSPVNGHVLRLMDENARTVMAGTPLLEVGDTQDIELVVDVLSEDAVQIAVGNLVHITGWGGPSVLSGSVRLVEPYAYTKISTLGVEEQRVNIIIDLDQIPEALGVGFRAEASIVIWQSDDALSIPVSAVFQRKGSWYTCVVLGEVVEEREIQVGARSATQVEVISGLNEADEVVVFPGQDVQDGVTISG